MTGEIEELYSKIGQEISKAIKGNWISAWLDVTIKPGVISLKGRYLVVDQGDEKNILPTRQLVVLFNTLHTRMVEQLNEDWISARFSLESTGKFEIVFEYSD